MSNIYILKDGITNDILRACDTEANAEQLKANMILTGEYKSISVNPYELYTGTVGKLTVVKVSGKMYNDVPNTLKVEADNPSGVVTDNLRFDVTGETVTYSGQVNLTEEEQAMTDATTLLASVQPRVRTWVAGLFKTRLENDNA